MKILFKKNIILGITGGVAAYKTIEIIKKLKEEGASVRVILTKSANLFVTKCTLRVVSGLPILENFVKGNSISHIKLANWADLVILAPATANIIAKLSCGIADDLLTLVCLATLSKIIIVPSMNRNMYVSKSVQYNIKRLERFGMKIFYPEIGRQACGCFGIGRMMNTQKIVNLVIKYFHKKNNYKNLNFMITAGPTREMIDPVRFISNFSSGKMGFFLAEAASCISKNVILISGPVNLPTPKRVKRINVISALEMQKEVMKRIDRQNIFIGCAAVSDYRIQKFSKEKIKKNSNKIKINFIKNPDIIKSIGHLKKNRPYVVGFAAETCNIEKNAIKKIKEKKLDLICANNVTNFSKNFSCNKNALSLIWKNKKKNFPYQKKSVLAKKLIKEIIKNYEKKNRNSNS
ncbi:bifunctional phosphopantothenoylcysteine decarboxylase/phosphopantothenate--cysteine ligase CoaBC [bacterium endosymbiont of Pedicinus badii]|uniref:bifunctional phosphopantothenoylcysteine decarboxylase/phosphopantothenate--cysteine ligase CoaBC n=1 Tax=bacterium endosymbiont of Pedicinus badii TaxID=1719126 RepID=UPI0009BBF90C|nr:bifunctional phosphopantothenoylcysteine decarboxylase/phosphopantothenate--cysteine ligase CoaBC [bacterium endosymbiont of Pedicinus badii]OQM34062.1 bifunctional phosphopantothenoylcysteine decarboxylase/phosphopantothenate synthase [bacterium endosymbiont of Pedicinus badii]